MVNINDEIRDRLVKQYKMGNWIKISVEEYIVCQCTYCDKKCIHEGAYRRYPEAVGGLGLCKNLKK